MLTPTKAFCREINTERTADHNYRLADLRYLDLSNADLKNNLDKNICFEYSV